MNTEKMIVNVRLDRIWPNPFQTRLSIDYDHVAELAADILSNGLLQIPTARPAKKEGVLADQMGEYDVELAFGHNRLQAFYQLQSDHPEFKTMPVILRELSDEEMAITAWAENESRKQLNPVERAAAVKRFMESFGWTHQQVAEKIRMDRSTVTNLLRMLRLPDLALKRISDGELSQRQGMALVPFYELTETEQDTLLEDAEFSDFLPLAASGQVNSDTIREMVNEAIARIHPAPAQFEFEEKALSIPLPEVEGNSEEWKQKDIEGNDVAPVVDPYTPEKTEEINQNQTAEIMAANPPPLIPGLQPVVNLTEADLAVTDEDLAIKAEQEKRKTGQTSGEEKAESKSWADSTYTVTFGFQVDEGDALGRQVFISARRNEGSPLFKVIRQKSFNLPWQIEELIKELHPEDFENASTPLDPSAPDGSTPGNTPSAGSSPTGAGSSGIGGQTSSQTGISELQPVLEA